MAKTKAPKASAVAAKQQGESLKKKKAADKKVVAKKQVSWAGMLPDCLRMQPGFSAARGTLIHPHIGSTVSCHIALAVCIIV
jgi:hypothetical protein